MSVTVRIPTQLRTLTGGSGEVPVEGSTVGEVLKALDTAHEGFADRLFDESGELRRFVNVFLADEVCGSSTGWRHRSPMARRSRSSRPWPGVESLARRRCGEAAQRGSAGPGECRSL